MPTVIDSRNNVKDDLLSLLRSAYCEGFADRDRYNRDVGEAWTESLTLQDFLNRPSNVNLVYTPNGDPPHHRLDPRSLTRKQLKNLKEAADKARMEASNMSPSEKAELEARARELISEVRDALILNTRKQVAYLEARIQALEKKARSVRG